LIDLKTADKALRCADFALDKKAFNLKLLKVAGISSLTDYILIASGRSDRQVIAIAEGVRLGMKEACDEMPLAVEGMAEGRWVLIDFGDIMVHVFQQPIRDFYDLDGLWNDAEEIPLPAEGAVAAGPA